VPEPALPIDPKKRGLGRGLSALLPSTPSPAPVAPQPAAAPSLPPGKRVYFAAGIEELYPGPEQPRRKFDELKLAELVESMKTHGVITPLVVRPRPEGGYYLIAGERRWRAAQRAGMHDVPVVVQDVDQVGAFERALVENLQRADLGPLEEAAAFQRMIDELGYTQDKVADRVGKDRSTIANALRLLKLPAPVRQMVDDERLSMGHARALLPLEDPVAIERAARTVIDKGLSVRATEALIKATKSGKGKPAKSAAPAKSKSASVRDVEDRLAKALGGPVTITEDAHGKAGTIQIRYMDLDHLDRLLDRLL